MGRTTHADVITSVSTVRTCTRASSASPWMDSAPCWFIWAWLADSTGTTGTAPAGTTTGTGGPQGTASPSPVAWKENDIDLSSSRLESRPFSTANSSELVVSSCASSSSFASSASGSGTGSGSALALHSFNFLILDSEQQKHQLPRCGTPSSTTSDTTDHRPNETATNTASTCRSASAFNSFLLCSPSTLNSEVDIENKHHLVGIHDPFPRIRQRSRTPKMPGSTLSASDEPRFPNSTYSAANITANPSQWRPHTSRSGRSARSASPLFARWARRHHQQLDVHGSNDSRSSTERKSTSSNGNGNSLNNDDASHKHTYNFSTSTMTRSSSSSRRQSQSALPPPLTREEFEALPLAIQRKVRAVFRLSVTFCSCNYFSPRSSRSPNWSATSGHWAALELLCVPASNGNSDPLASVSCTPSTSLHIPGNPQKLSLKRNWSVVRPTKPTRSRHLFATHQGREEQINKSSILVITKLL